MTFIFDFPLEISFRSKFCLLNRRIHDVDGRAIRAIRVTFAFRKRMDHFLCCLSSSSSLNEAEAGTMTTILMLKSGPLLWRSGVDYNEFRQKISLYSKARDITFAKTCFCFRRDIKKLHLPFT